MSRRIQNIQFFDDGKISIEWLETEEQRPEGGEFHTTYVTIAGTEAAENVEYYVNELREDVDELLHHTLKMLKVAQP